MKTIYIDTNYHCHTEYASGWTAIETDAFDAYSDKAIECYIYEPQEMGEFIQCFDTKRADAYNRQYEYDCDNMMSLADVADLVELVYEDDLGIIG